MIAGGLTWYVTRASGAVALVLLTVAFVLGIPSARSADRRAAPRLVVQLLHRNASLLAVAFVVVHVVTTVADSFVHVRFVDAVVPFVGDYRPVWLGLGAIAGDVLLAIVATSLLRERMSYRTWRNVHLAAYASWPIAFLHGLEIGSDTPYGWMRWTDVVCAAAVVAAVGWRLMHPVPSTPLGRVVAR